MEKLKLLIGLLGELRYEVATNKPIILLSFPLIHLEVDDLSQWNSLLKENGVRLTSLQECHEDRIEHPKWYSLSWLFTECYLYRRICDLVAMSDLNGFDPFMMKKRAALESSVDSVRQFLTHLSECQTLASDDVLTAFQVFLQGSLWANEFDLSLHPDQSHPTTSVASDLSSYISQMSTRLVVNDVESITSIWSNRLKELCTQSSADFVNKSRQHTTAIVLDNAGPELLADLCFAEFILHHKLTDQVFFYPKRLPWFVSDVTPADFHWILNTGLLSAPFNEEVHRHWATIFRQRFDSGKFVIRLSNFWTLPCAFCDLRSVDSALYDELLSTDVVLFKGDLNYRKILGDRQWIPDSMAHKIKAFASLQLRGASKDADACRPTIGDRVLLGEPEIGCCCSRDLSAPLVCALRVCKSDVAVGLRPDVLRQVRDCTEDWWTDGHYGMIQIISPTHLE